MERPPTTPGEPGRQAGFTLLELITVLALEAVLRENLFRLRDLIDQYYLDKGQYPATLETLVEDGYLRQLPKDPITQDADWTPVFQEPDPDRPGDPPGVYDVKSSSEAPSLSGTPYNEW